MREVKARQVLSIGRSKQTDDLEAVRETVQEALRGLQEKPQFGLMFCTPHRNHRIIAEQLNLFLPEVEWSGCTSAGIFANNNFIQDGIVLGLLSGPELKVSVGVAQLRGSQSREAGALAVSRALKDASKKDPNSTRTLIILADARSGNIAEVIRGAVEEAGTQNVWAGGGVGNANGHWDAAEFANGQVYVDHVVIIVIDSPFTIATGIAHGWQPYGPPTLVTRSSGTTVYEFEYESAFEIYRQTAASRGEIVTLEEFKKFSIAHPLGIPQADGSFVIRDPIGVRNDGSLEFIAEVPDGCLVKIMNGNRSELLNAARQAAEFVKRKLSYNIGGALVFDCISRFMFLDGHYQNELNTIQNELGPSTPFFGCLTFGEVGVLGCGMPQFHNKTSVVMGVQGV